MKPILDLSKNNDYRSWVKELKQRYLSARLKASIEANRKLLEYYWSLGRDIADKQYANTYGSGFYKTLSHDLRSEMPEEKGFSETNLKYMYYFYRLYSQLIENRPQVADDLSSPNLQHGVEDFKQQNLPQVADDLLKEICSIPWQCCLLKGLYRLSVVVQGNEFSGVFDLSKHPWIMSAWLNRDSKSCHFS